MTRPWLVPMLCLALLAASCKSDPEPHPLPSPTLPGLPSAAGRPLPEKIWGLTLDSVDPVEDAVDSVAAMKRTPTVRVVFDEGASASDYVDPVSRLSSYAYVLGELLDSYFVKDCDFNCYVARTQSYLMTLSGKVDLWEVGNEINGEWLGDGAMAKAQAAYRMVKLQGGQAALTLYYNEDCWEKADHEMFRWAEANVPAEMRSGLDYVLVSYYEKDCNDLRPAWGPVFKRLALMFPNSKVGFGEVGLEKGDASEKAAYLRRYYTMPDPSDRFIGGFFWWYGTQDLVPRSKPLWAVFNEVIGVSSIGTR